MAVNCCEGRETLNRFWGCYCAEWSVWHEYSLFISLFVYGCQRHL